MAVERVCALRRSDSSTAGPQSAGYILQLDRALYHLATASSADDVVAVEHFDDVAVFRDGKLIIAEQDKSTVSNKKKILEDRSYALWRTLQIWLRIRETAEGKDCQKHFLFVNKWLSSPLADLLKNRITKNISSVDILAELKKVAAKKNGAKIDNIINDVMLRDDEFIIKLIEKIEIIVADNSSIARDRIANGLAVHPNADASAIIDGLLGWLTTKVRTHWGDKEAAIITRREIILQCHTLQDIQKKSTFLPRASVDIEILPTIRESMLTRNFVEHLSRISAEKEDIVQAIDHLLKFNIEKHRLIKSGTVSDDEWENRSLRLFERWSNIMRRRRREMLASTANVIGQAVLADVTYEHHEHLDGQPCNELYMTSGNYHRLADSDTVWWDPGFNPGDGK